ncbi:MAG: hypothetical protein MI867_27830 [Pseudomonadales bacterium]|nr:hypothetical protein [Pseudomonadales bacterium]
MEARTSDKQVLLGFEIPQEDADSMLHLLGRIRSNPSQPGLSREAAQMVSRLLELGIDALYFDVMSQITAHPGAKRSADKGIHTVTNGAKLVIRKMVNALEPDELPLFADYMDSLFVCSNQGQWYLAFPLSQNLAADLNRTMLFIKSDAETHTYNNFIADTLCEISDQAIIYFYSKPTKLFKIRPFVKKSADLGIKTVNKGLHFVIRQLFKKTRQKELLVFSELLENQLVYA